MHLLEVLAVIAYNEPITRLKVDEIRGVNSAQIVRRLLARGFIKKYVVRMTPLVNQIYIKQQMNFLIIFGLSSKKRFT
ncbi:MAG: SMC-Scp complex subunit ScpB [Clostridium sp.]|nr:MAG: SMC-Scp complex subunit ScpB [Clostridium sp.]